MTKPMTPAEHGWMGAVRGLGIFALLGALAFVGLQAGVGTAQSPAESKLEAYPGFRFAHSHLDEASFDREEKVRELLTQECMIAAGWPYSPTASARVSSWDDVRTLVPKDENADFAASLERPEREAYYQALYGLKDPFSPSQGASGGCAGKAFEELPGVYALYSELMPEIDAMRLAIRQDPKWDEANRAWSQCMALAAHKVSSPEEMLAQADTGDPEAALMVADDATGCQSTIMENRQKVRIQHENSFADRFVLQLEAHKRRHAEVQKIVDSFLNS